MVFNLIELIEIYNELLLKSHEHNFKLNLLKCTYDYSYQTEPVIFHWVVNFIHM